ncbi:putative conserved hypothetical protein [Colletotrichum sublineola]|uniref:Polyprotein n=1 Tax=Colletotrichum sublineola TaxID=1173701 RepID=A0A066X1K3_COLSU|nr:putative conserved hypothetical protein [Colletotrichum sublineola]
MGIYVDVSGCRASTDSGGADPDHASKFFTFANARANGPFPYFLPLPVGTTISDGNAHGSTISNSNAHGSIHFRHHKVASSKQSTSDTTPLDIRSSDQDDFEGWTEEDFVATHRDTLTGFRNHLLRRGIFINTTRGGRIAPRVYAAISAPEAPKWTKEQVIANIGKTNDFKTRANNPNFIRNIIGLSPGTPPLRQLTDLVKIYPEELKYGGGAYKSIKSKLAIFQDHYFKAGIPQDQFASTFFIILKGAAADFYANHLYNPSHTLNFHTIVTMLKGNFKTEETYQACLTELQRTTFASTIRNNPNKSKPEALKILIQQVNTLLQSVTRIGTPSDAALRNQLLNSYRGVEEYALALFNPAPTFASVYSQLRSTVSNAAEIKQQQQHIPRQYPTDTDRTYNSQHGRHRYNPSNHNNRDYANNGPQRPFNRDQRQRNTSSKKCYVCGKPGCWSTKHSKDERQQSYRRYKDQYPTEGSIEAFQQFVADFKGYKPFESDNKNDNHADHNNKLSTTFFTSTTFFNSTAVDSPSVFSKLRNQATTHFITKEDLQGDQDKDAQPTADIFTINNQYSATTFQGIMPDSGATEHSTAGYQQYLALHKLFRGDLPLDTGRAREARIRFSNGIYFISKGTINIATPLGTLTFHVMPSNTPFLLYLTDIDRQRIKFNNLTNQLIQGNTIVPSIAWHHLTNAKLRQVHRRFGHPSVQRLHKVLQQSGNKVEISALRKIARVYHQCQLNAAAPGRFKFSLQDNNYNFNHKIIVNMIDVYLSLPDWIVIDAGLNFHAAEFKQSTRALSIHVKEVPIKAHNSISKVKRYHTPLRRAYKIFRNEGESPTIALQLAVKAINNTAGPDGLIPTLLVFRAYPQIADSSPPSPSITKRAETVKKAIEAVRQIHAKRQVNKAITTRNSPDTSKTATLPLQSPVQCTVEFPRGPRTFRSTIIKPYHHEEPKDRKGNAASKAANKRPPENNDNNNKGPTPSNDKEEDKLATTPTKKVLDTIIMRAPPPRRRPGRPRKYNTNFLNKTGLGATLEESDLLLAINLRKKGIITTPGKPFKHAVKLKINTLIARGVFQFVKYDEHLHAGQQIFKAHIVNKEAILTQSPTIQQASQRLILTLAPSLLLKPGFVVWLQDITQAYTQSATPLNRTILTRLPKQIQHRYPKGTIIQVIKPLYGITEAGTHWMQTDNTIRLSDKSFSAHEVEELAKATFTTKEKQILSINNPLAFNSGIVTLTANSKIILKQKGQGKKLRPVDLTANRPAADGSFANNKDITSQLGFLITLANKITSRCPDNSNEFTITRNIVHFSSTKCKRVTRSILASEVYSMVAGADMAYAISTTLKMVTDRMGLPPIPTILCTDSYSLYECLVKLGTTKEKRLMIDIMALRQSYERREVHEVRWIRGTDNPADGFTKATPNKALEELVGSGRVKIGMEGWVSRT